MRRIALVLMLSFVACRAGEPAPGQVAGGGGVSEQIATLVRKGEGTTVDLASITPFEWTRLYVFPPYTSQESAEDALGFRWPADWTTSIAHDEVANFLVFVNGSEIVAAFDHSRNGGDFAYLNRSEFLPESARFVVQRRGTLSDGEPHYVLSEGLAL